MISTLEEAAQLLTKIRTEDAQHVLWFYERKGYEPGSFTQKLLEVIALADPGNRAKLSLAFPGEVSAMRLATELSRGLELLRQVASVKQAELDEAMPDMQATLYNLADMDRKAKEGER